MRFQVTLFCGSLILQIRWFFFYTFSGNNFCACTRSLFFLFSLQYILQFYKFELTIRALINSQRVELVKNKSTWSAELIGICQIGKLRFYVRPFFWLMLQFFLSWAAQINKSWCDCPENILSVSWVRYIQWEQRNQNSRSEWFYIKNCLSFILQVLIPMPSPLSVITMKLRIK